MIFGDGAGAVILEATDDPDDRAGILEIRLHAEGRHARRLWIENPSSGHRPVRFTHEMLDDGSMFPRMEGKFVFKHAVTRMPEVLRETIDAASVKLEDIDLFLFHQANLRINEYVANQLGKVKTGPARRDTINSIEFNQMMRDKDLFDDHFTHTAALRVFNNIQRYGNCSAASIPMLLAEANRDGRIQPGQLVSMTSFGSGFTWASALVRW